MAPQNEPGGDRARANLARSAGRWLSHSARALTDIVIPPVCANCQTPLAQSHALCGTCWREVRFIRPPVCDRLGIPLPFDTGHKTVSAAALAEPPDFDRARIVAHHDGPMQQIISGFKYADRQEARILLANWLISAGRDLIADADLIVPVPLHRWRLLKRKFNQSAVLAKEVARVTGKPVAYQILIRHKPTAPQVSLSGSERRRNPRGAFRVAAPTLRPPGKGKRAHPRLASKRILLIDDVMTTGATANACARALKAAGAAHVDVLTLSLAQMP